MEISFTPHSWESCCDPNRLEFRGACNAAAEPGWRPLKRRVVDRLSADSDGRALFKKIWEHVRGEPQKFLEELGKSDSWKTLVAEQRIRETTWLDPVKREFGGKIFERLGAAFEKLFDRESHPVARMVTLIASSAVSIAGVQWCATRISDEVLVFPIRAELMTSQNQLPVKLAFSADSTEIPIKLSDAALGLEVKLSADKEPLKVRFVTETPPGDGKKSDDALTGVTAQLERGVRSLERATASLDLLSRSSPPAMDFKPVAEPLMALSADLKTLATSYNNEKSDWDRRFLAVARTSVSSQQRVTAVLQPNSSSGVILPTFDMQSGHAYAAATICAGKISRGLKVETLKFEVRAGKDRACPSNPGLTLEEGQGSDELPGFKGWRMTLNAVNHHWLHGTTAAVTLTPTGEPEGQATVAGTSAPVVR